MFKSIYYYMRLPLGWMFYYLFYWSLTVGGWCMTWSIWLTRLALWADLQGVEIFPESAPPGRIIDGKDVCAVKKKKK